jgi:iron complex transport system ATP-binding protein
MTPALAAERLTLERAGATLLHGLDWSATAGELHALLGPNGAGKTSLIRALAGEWPASGGTVRLDGRPLAAFSATALARRRAVLPQADALDSGFTVSELLRLGRLAAPPRPRAAEDALIAEVLDTLSLTGLAGRRYTALSGGERRRAQLGRVLAQVWDATAPVLLLDEPVSSLDPAHQHGVMQRLRALAARGWTVIASLHDLALASTYAHRLSLLREGQLIASGPADTVLDGPTLQKLYGADLAFSPIIVDGRRHWLAGPATR